MVRPGLRLDRCLRPGLRLDLVRPGVAREAVAARVVAAAGVEVAASCVVVPARFVAATVCICVVSSVCFAVLVRAVAFLL